MLCRSLRRLAVQRTPTQLGAVLQKEIEGRGPMPFAHFMDRAMRDPEHGYFTTKTKVIGSDADFVTAPELLPEFGWCFGHFVKQCVAVLANESQEITLVEAGPGTGRLMYHLLNFLKYESPETLSRLHVQMVEVSPVMIRQQQRNLSAFTDHLASIEWSNTLHTAFTSSPNTPTVIVSNEYLDVLPVHILARSEASWKEQMVDVKGEQDFFFTLGDVTEGVTEYISDVVVEDEGIGSIEVCPQAVDDMVLMGKRVEEFGGVVLAVDYGRDVPSTQTLQGMHRQETCPPLLNPGEIDISWHVDFGCIREKVASACPSLAMTPALPQADFLNTMGFSSMIQNRRDAGEIPQHFEERIKLLADSTQMGGYHRAVAICNKLLYPPPGF